MLRAAALRMTVVLFLCLVGIALLQQGYPFLAVSAHASAPPPAYQDVSREAGITHNRAPDLEMASGQAWGDYDRDGWVDLYVTDSSGPNTLYRNRGDGTFERSIFTDQVALAQAYSGGAVFADYDNDGWQDLFVANWGVNNLFHNQAGQGFVDVTRQAGLLHDANSKTASWGDFNLDGYLDLYVANWSCYPKCGRPMDGDTDRLYQNNGNGTFTDVTDFLQGGVTGAGFVASFFDFDNDGDPDLYLVNDEFINPVGNKLWRNDGPGCQGWCFTQVAEPAGAASKVFGMGLAVADFDNDLDFDIFFSNVGPMELLENQGDGTFREIALEAGVQTPNGIGWGAVFLDFDNDGWRDLYLALADTTNHRDVAANRLYRNDGAGKFAPVPCSNEAADVRMSLGVAYADYNRDGWVDLVVGNMDEGYRLYRNQAYAQVNNRWLALELSGAGPVNRDAVGARVTLTTPDGLTQMQEVISGSSLGAGSELTLFFGLGQAEYADLTIRWPDGKRQVFQAVSANQRYRLDYPLAGETPLQPAGWALPARAALPVLVSPLPGAFLLALLGLVLLSLAVPAWTAPLRSAGPGLALLGVLFLLAAAWGQPGAVLPGWLPGSADARLRSLLQQAGVQPPTLPEPASPALVALGEALFWDPELSGNRDIACATCHHPQLGTGDNLSVSLGTGGQGLGETRSIDLSRELVPRNASPLFNLGYEEWTVLFWDGRVSGSRLAGFHSPASDRLPEGLDSVLAAQAMFPVTSRDEMRGQRGDRDIFGQPNELAVIQDYTSGLIWQALMQRLMAIPEYVDLFQSAFPETPLDALGFQHAANALAAYQREAFTFEDSPFDRYLVGQIDALSQPARRGALLFYGEARCAACHAGALLTDQQFYNLAVPQIGPGKGREQPFDLGLARETGNDCDRFKFRTPPLRNVALTGPWMHNGSLTSLEAVIRHHLQPEASLRAYDPSQLSTILRDTCQDQPETLQRLLSTADLSAAAPARPLTEADIQDLLVFLEEALTSPSARRLDSLIPASVPSGLPVGGNLNTPPAQQGRRESAVPDPGFRLP